jgi:hypothetical protein
MGHSAAVHLRWRNGKSIGEEEAGKGNEKSELGRGRRIINGKGGKRRNRKKGKGCKSR